MSQIQRFLIRGSAIAALLLVGASTIHAQSFSFELELSRAPYACTWKAANGNTGVALVTFTLGMGPGGIPQGTVRNFYADGSQIVRNIKFFADISEGGYIFQQDNNVQCHVELYPFSREMVFTNCTNGNLQNCRRWQ
jgi:hypothetical protein